MMLQNFLALLRLRLDLGSNEKSQLLPVWPAVSRFLLGYMMRHVLDGPPRRTPFRNKGMRLKKLGNCEGFCVQIKHEIFRSSNFIGRPSILDVDQKRYENGHFIKRTAGVVDFSFTGQVIQAMTQCPGEPIKFRPFQPPRKSHILVCSDKSSFCPWNLELSSECEILFWKKNCGKLARKVIFYYL
jgi:hypothetical protein